jgi:hypothetical protein
MSDQFTIETHEYAAEVQVTDAAVVVSIAESPPVEVVLGFELALASQGPPGPPGAPAYEYSQLAASQTWTISHNLGYKPVAQVFDTGSQLIEAEVSHLSTNTLVILLTLPTAGFARLI